MISTTTTTKLVSGYKTSTEQPCWSDFVEIRWRGWDPFDENKLAHSFSPADRAKRTPDPEGACTLAPKEK